MADQPCRDACPFCGSTETEGKGKTKVTRRFRCRQCGANFRDQGYIPDRHFTEAQVGEGLAAVLEAHSIEVAAHHVRRTFSLPDGLPSRTTVGRWYKAHVDQTTERLANCMASPGARWTVVRSHMCRRGTSIAVVDDASQFVLATLFADESQEERTSDLLQKALTRPGLLPEKSPLGIFKATSGWGGSRFEPQGATVPDGLNISQTRDDRLIWTILGADGDWRHELRLSNRFLRFPRLDDGQRFLEGRAVMHNFFKRPGDVNSPTPAQLVGVRSPAFGSWIDVLKWLHRDR